VVQPIDSSGQVIMVVVGETTMSDYQNRYLPVKIQEAIDNLVTIRVTKKSSFITRLCYNKQMGQLTIEMKSGTYAYYAVPWDTAKTLWEANSYGKAYNRLIKGQFASEKIQ
jgi:hypothetical protein